MNINQILNSALLNESEMTMTNSEAQRRQNLAAEKPLTDKELKNYKTDKEAIVNQQVDTNQTPLTRTQLLGKGWEKFNKDNPNALKYGGAAAIGLGAGIGALALAKKLRAKKAAAKAGKTKKD